MSDVVEFVEEVLAVVLGDLDVGGGVEGGKKHAFPGCDHRYVGYVDDKGFVGAHELRMAREDGLGCGLTSQYVVAEIVEHHLPEFSLTVVFEIDYILDAYDYAVVCHGSDGECFPLGRHTVARQLAQGALAVVELLPVDDEAVEYERELLRIDGLEEEIECVGPEGVDEIFLIGRIEDDSGVGRRLRQLREYVDGRVFVELYVEEEDVGMGYPHDRDGVVGASSGGRGVDAEGVGERLPEHPYGAGIVIDNGYAEVFE